MRAELDQTDLGSKLEVSQPTISRWEKGIGCPSARHLEVWLDACRPALTPELAKSASELAEKWVSTVGNGDIDRFSGRIDQLTNAALTGSELVYDTRIPYYADVAAGLGEVQDYVTMPKSSVSVPREIYESDPTCYAMRVVGDSMAPHLLQDDMVVVSPAAKLVDGCIVAAFIDPDGDVVKVYRELDGGSILLQPMNPGYPTTLLKPNGEKQARIWGRIVMQLREL